MTVLEKIEQSQLKKDVPSFRAGDQVRVHVKIKEGEKERVQVFEGAVIGRRRAASHSTFTVQDLLRPRSGTHFPAPLARHRQD